MAYSAHTVLFEDDDQIDIMYLENPKVGDVIKIGLFSEGELMYYKVVLVNSVDQVVTLARI